MKAARIPVSSELAGQSPGLAGLATSLAGIKPFPRVVLSIREAAADPRKSVADVGRLVEGDVGVAANLLRVANAPACGLRERCSTVRHAVSLLGLKRVCEVVTSAAALTLLETAQRRVPDGASHAIAVGGVARLLAPITGASPDLAFTAGLLHDVGSLLLLQSGDAFYEGLVEQYGEGEAPTIAEERALLGFDHAALGAEVLRQWNLPAPLPEIVSLHHDWDGAVEVGGVTCLMVALVRVADTLVPELARTVEPSLEQVQGLAADPAFNHLGLQAEELLKLWRGLRRACEKNEGFAEEPAAAPAVLSALDAAPLRAAPPPRGPVVVSEPSRMRGAWIGAAVLIVAAAGLFAVLVH